MSKSIFLWAAAATVALTSCSKENASEIPDNNNQVAQFTAGIQSRATGTTWAAGDAIGIFMKTAGQQLASAAISEKVNNFKYTTTMGNSSFTATPDQVVYFPVDGSAVDFISYYPYRVTITDYTYPINVASQADQPSLDLMYSANATSKTKVAPKVALTFDHKLSNLVVNLTHGEGLKPADLTDVKVKITGQKTIGAMSLVTGAVTPSVTQEANQSINLKMTGVMGEAIILPSVAVAGRQLIMTISTGEEFVWDIPSTRDFASGSKYIYNVTLNRTELKVTTTITPWVEGNGATGEDVEAGQPNA